MKSFFLIVAACASSTLTATPTLAIERHQIDSLPCASIQAIVTREGAAILRYRSKRDPSLPLYDRYVANSAYCSFGEYAAPAIVPSADQKSCRLRKCERIEFDFPEPD